jgi:Base plate wedge protein 53
MKYFESFPGTLYTFDKNTINQQVVTDILARSTFLREIANNTSIAYEYNVKETDTPEIIAHKVYGDAYRSWIILLFNQIINPYYDFPLTSVALDSYVENKYNQTINQSLTTIHHYEKEVTKEATYNGLLIDKTVETFIIGEFDVDYSDNSITPATLPGTADTSLVVSTETIAYPNYVLKITTINKAISNYTYEVTENEKKRSIRLLDEKFVQRVEDEFRSLMSNG